VLDLITSLGTDYLQPIKHLTIQKTLPMYTVLVIGSAGAGKTTFCLNLYDHLSTHNHNPTLINLDPSQQSNNTYHHDICTYITTQNVMEATDLGPNSSILKAFATMADHLENVEIEGYCVVDMPGQIEIFVHSESFLKTIAYFKGQGRCVIVNVFDFINFKSVERFLGNGVSMCMCVGRVELPFINLVSKCDLFLKDENDEDNLSEDDEDLCFDQLLLRTKFHKDLYQFLEHNSVLNFTRIRYTEEGMTDVIYMLDSVLHYYDDLDYVEPREE
ncbi:Putative transcription factor FET5, partial [Trachipleistophora hominis]